MKLKGAAGKEKEAEQPLFSRGRESGWVLHAFALVCCCCCCKHKKSARASPQPGSCAVGLDHKNITTQRNRSKLLLHGTAIWSCAFWNGASANLFEISQMETYRKTKYTIETLSSSPILWLKACIHSWPWKKPSLKTIMFCQQRGEVSAVTTTVEGVV